MNVILNLSPHNAATDDSVAYLQMHAYQGAVVLTGPPDADHLDAADVSKLAEVNVPHEKVAITGHGTVDKCGGSAGTLFTARDVSDILAKGGLHGPVEIELYCCDTGMSGAPFALNLKVALVQAHKIMCSVSAPTGWLSPDDKWDGSWTVEVADRVFKPADKAFYRTTKCF